ncbi:hypothetical protein GGI15_002373 [Coemansia interrupta]|uniref:Uncharacterized protein n=1 Tax=Coemansia interrupta TaxID=1126814 RepID=A0A9W8HLU1_9FUNG|nr:hypothetical protein GGI15_002373 [Coemansia interrupta]
MAPKPLLALRSPYSTGQRGRDRVQFPWVWPADADSIPRHSNLKSRITIPLFGQLFDWYTNVAGRGMIYTVFDKNYLEEMRQKMVHVALASAAEAINKHDCDMLDQILSPHLSRVYRRALDNLKAQGVQLKIDVEYTSAPTLGGMMVNVGAPDAFDKSVPFSRRSDKYVFKYTQNMRVGVPRLTREDSMRTSISKSLKATVDEWVSVELWYKLPATVKVDLWKGNKLIDSDRGAMDIPITFSTPHYEGIMNLGRAFKQEEDASDLEPFRWFISDLFNIVDMREVQQIYSTQKSRNE